jgi:hypothetical protein
LPECLRRLETMPGRNRHAPGRNLRWGKLADPEVAEPADGLREQPAELLNRLRLAIVLGEVVIDELAQPRRLHQALLSAKTLERPLERFDRGLLRLEAAPLHAPRAAPAGSVAVGPESLPVWAARLQFEYLTLLRHARSPLSTRELQQ